MRAMSPEELMRYMCAALNEKRAADEKERKKQEKLLDDCLCASQVGFRSAAAPCSSICDAPKTIYLSILPFSFLFY